MTCHTWISQSYNGLPFCVDNINYSLQIQFDSPVNVRYVALRRGHYSTSQDVRGVYLQYTLDGTEWMDFHNKGGHSVSEHHHKHILYF